MGNSVFPLLVVLSLLLLCNIFTLTRSASLGPATLLSISPEVADNATATTTTSGGVTQSPYNATSSTSLTGNSSSPRVTSDPETTGTHSRSTSPSQPTNASTSTTSGSHTHITEEGGHRNTEEGGHHDHELRYKVAKVDFNRVAAPLIVTAWILLASIAKIGFHLHNGLSSIFPESCLLILLGVILGVILHLFKVDGYTLNATTFFFYLLPPIILDSGYFMPNRAFFDNLGTILLFAFVATVFNTLALGLSIWGSCKLQFIPTVGSINLLHCFVFASLLAAVDPVAVLAVFEDLSVNEVLNIVLFGESLLNDGVSVVLYHMFETYSEIGASNIITVDILAGIGSFLVVAFGATAIGVLMGLLAGFISRFTSGVRVIEPLIVFVLGYLSYMTAELFHLSGILACTFCGITMRQYVEANVSDKSRTTIKYFMKMLASVCETIIFMLLGVSTVISDHHWDTAFVLLVLVFCLVYRTLGVMIFSFFVNRFRVDPLSKVDQFIMAYGGLRGAIAFSLVVLLNEDMFPHKRLFITSTLVVIYFTCFVQGATIKPLVKVLNVKKDPKRKMNMNERIHIRMIDHMMGGIEDIAGNVGHNRIREQFQHLSKSYLKPALLRKGHMGRGRSIMDVYTRLANDEMKTVLNTSSYTALSQMHVASGICINGTSAATPSMAQLFRLQRAGSRTQLNTLPKEDVTGMFAMSDGDACFDIGSVSDVLQSRKMRDDSKIHHIIDDVMFKPRKKMHIQKVSHQMLPNHSQTELAGHMSDLYKPRPVMVNYQKTKNGNSKPKKSVNQSQNRKKVVSFEPKDNLSVNKDNSVSDSEYEGITFKVDTPDMSPSSPGYTPTSAESSLPWKRNHDVDTVSTTGELDPARTLTSFPAITINNNNILSSNTIMDTPLKITIPSEPWCDTSDPVVPDNNKYVTASPCRLSPCSPALSPLTSSPRRSPLSSPRRVFRFTGDSDPAPVPEPIVEEGDDGDCVTNRTLADLCAQEPEVMSAGEDEFRKRHASAARSRGSLDNELIEDAIRTYQSGVENAGYILDEDDNTTIDYSTPSTSRKPSSKQAERQDSSTAFLRACSNSSETSL